MGTVRAGCRAEIFRNCLFRKESAAQDAVLANVEKIVKH